jgi:hypothetical protein
MPYKSVNGVTQYVPDPEPNRFLTQEQARAQVSADPHYNALPQQGRQLVDQMLQERFAGADALGGFSLTPTTPAEIDQLMPIARATFVEQEIRERNQKAGLVLDRSQLPPRYARELEAQGVTDAAALEMVVKMSEHRKVQDSQTGVWRTPTRDEAIQHFIANAKGMGDEAVGIAFPHSSQQRSTEVG